MGKPITISTPHGAIAGWRSDPLQSARGGVLVIQEIFGVNPHIRNLADRYAEAGLVAIAPSLFDPVRPDVELDYDSPGFETGRNLTAALGFDRAIDLIDAAANVLRHEGLNVAAIGFCWGGSLAFLANTRLGLPSIGYYGARSLPFLDEPLRAPAMFHFGADDPYIPPADVERHRQKLPNAAIHVYPQAGHGFNRDVDPRHYHPQSAATAHRRSLDFIDEVLA